MLHILDIFGTGFDIVYNDIPPQDLFFTFLGIGSIWLIYKFRKIPPFNIIWMFVVAIFIYALIGYITGKVREKWRS